ncbi:MAG: CotH kinase family protein [Bacteroidales bacterium]|jgi:spore coat protein H
MKTFCFATMIGVFLLIHFDRILAQATPTQLHQIELMNPVSKKTPINAYQRLQDFENFYGSSPMVISNSISQPVQSNDDKPNLTDLGRKIENRVNFTTDNSNYEKIQATSGQKISLKATALIINGDTLEPEEISTRGQSSLYYRRKSYSFSLKSEALFRHGERIESLKKFYILSLSMDKNYSSNRLAFEMMEAAQLFHLFYSFCELRINGQSEGICMVTERPEDWALKKNNSPLLIRRGYNSSIKKIKTGTNNESDKAKNYKTYFRQIYRSLNKYKGEELYKTLSDWLDMKVYMKWLAFNFFIRNGDYTDEVFFFIDPGTDKFSIIPWDYDDLFSVAPHEGYAESRKFLGDKLFFSTEDLLDRKIVTDPYLYKIYLIQLGELMNHLSADVLKRVFENTYAELYPYYSDNEIISKSQYDLYKDDNLIKLKSDLLSVYEQLIIYRNYFLEYLGSQNN